MNRKTIVLGVVALILIVGGLAFFFKGQDQNQKIVLNTPEAKKEVVPSKTFIDYSDPSGFSFSYPDNLSVSNRASGDLVEFVDPNAYADLQLFSKDKNGSLSLKIADTKFKTIEEWIKANEIPASVVPIEKKLGELKAYEVRVKDRLMLGALDQGILFTVEMPLLEENFWMEVYNKVVTDFAFAAPEPVNSQGVAAASGEEIIFEGEEVVE